MSKRSRHGFVLMAVLIVVLLVSMVAVSVMFRLRAEEMATATSATADQAWSAAMSGISVAMELVSTSSPSPAVWQSNAEKFFQHPVWHDGRDQWFFTIYSGTTADTTESAASLRYGLMDDASKINLNATHEFMLVKLPKMQPAVAQAMRDFVDPDDFLRPDGAEHDFYGGLPVPYPPRNGPLASLDQALLVRGWTPAVFYGEDANFNFRLDPNEDDGDTQFPPDDNSGELDRGLRQYLTVSSYDPNIDQEGLPRRNLNDPEETFFDVALPAAFVQYVSALRRHMIVIQHPVELLAAKGRFKDESGKEIEMDSGVGDKELPLLLDRFTTTNSGRSLGLINVHTASAIVLQTIPGIDLTLAEAIVTARQNLTPELRSTIAWIYTEKLVDVGTFKQLAPYLTTRSFQFHFNVIGYALPSGRYRVLEAHIDAALGHPVITYLRDLTKFGAPFPINPLPTDG
jgi:hypothetical protein